MSQRRERRKKENRRSPDRGDLGQSGPQGSTGKYCKYEESVVQRAPIAHPRTIFVSARIGDVMNVWLITRFSLDAELGRGNCAPSTGSQYVRFDPAKLRNLSVGDTVVGLELPCRGLLV